MYIGRLFTPITRFQFHRKVFIHVEALSSRELALWPCVPLFDKYKVRTQNHVGKSNYSPFPPFRCVSAFASVDLAFLTMHKDTVHLFESFGCYCLEKLQTCRHFQETTCEDTLAEQ